MAQIDPVDAGNESAATNGTDKREEIRKGERERQGEQESAHSDHPVPATCQFFIESERTQSDVATLTHFRAELASAPESSVVGAKGRA